MSSSPEMSATEENLVNELDDNLYKAIDSFTTKSEQSEEDFINGFIFLKKEEVVRHTGKECSPDPVMKKNTKNCERIHQQPECPALSSNLADDQLEEEVLDEGVRTSIMSNSGCKKITKFDNFVVDSNGDDELSGSEDELQNSGYIASFDKTVDDDKITDEVQTEHTKNSLESEVLQSSVDLSGPPKHNVQLISQEYKDEIDVVEETEETPPLFDGEGINPGEIEDNSADPSVEDVKNDTCLNASMKYKYLDKECNEDHSVNTEEASDAVEPFSLDEDFDYDNVVLTAKFTPSELEYLNSFTNQNIVDNDVS